MKARFYAYFFRKLRDKNTAYVTDLNSVLGRLASLPSGEPHREPLDGNGESRFYALRPVGRGFCFGVSHSEDKLSIVNMSSFASTPLQDRLNPGEVMSIYSAIAASPHTIAVAASQGGPRASMLAHFVSRVFKLARFPYKLELVPLDEHITEAVARGMHSVRRIDLRLPLERAAELGLPGFFAAGDDAAEIQVIIKARRARSVRSQLVEALDRVPARAMKRLQVKGALQEDGVVTDYIVDGMGALTEDLAETTAETAVNRLAAMVSDDDIDSRSRNDLSKRQTVSFSVRDQDLLTRSS